MKFNEIISISGKSGLFRLLNTRPDGLIVQSLEDGKSNFVSSRIHNVITLDNIAIYREHEETTPLRDVLIQMKANDANVPEPGSDETKLRAYLESILPDYDKQRVHVSDMKKLVKWYHILKAKDILPQPEEETKANEEAMSTQENETAEKATKPKKAKAVGTEDEGGTNAVVEEKEKPKRKPAAKKKAKED